MSSSNFHFFWGGPFSQWHRTSFAVDGFQYVTAEQFMMAMKARHFGDKDAERKIMATADPKVQKVIGRTVRNFDPKIWSEVSRDYVFKGNFAKFSLPSLRRILLATGAKELVEASPHDTIWGIGLSSKDPRAQDKKQWKGTNWLGETLMKVREALKMKNVSVIKGDLFKAPKGSILTHACNAQGRWGSGIAKIFADRFPEARQIYADHCRRLGNKVLGTCLIIDAGDYRIACLFTSENYGKFKDPQALILSQTRQAVRDLLSQTSESDQIAMCKINAGLFAVPWEDTQSVLEEFDRPMVIYEI